MLIKEWKRISLKYFLEASSHRSHKTEETALFPLESGTRHFRQKCWFSSSLLPFLILTQTSKYSQFRFVFRKCYFVMLDFRKFREKQVLISQRMKEKSVGNNLIKYFSFVIGFMVLWIFFIFFFAKLLFLSFFFFLFPIPDGLADVSRQLFLSFFFSIHFFRLPSRNDFLDFKLTKTV